MNFRGRKLAVGRGPRARNHEKSLFRLRVRGAHCEATCAPRKFRTTTRVPVVAHPQPTHTRSADSVSRITIIRGRISCVCACERACTYAYASDRAYHYAVGTMERNGDSSRLEILYFFAPFPFLIEACRRRRPRDIDGTWRRARRATYLQCSMNDHGSRRR